MSRADDDSCSCRAHGNPRNAGDERPRPAAACRAASFLLPRRVVKGQGDHRARRVPALVLGGDLDLDARARLVVRPLQVHERDVLLQDRRPGAGRGVADLPAVAPDRQAAAHGRARNLRRQADRAVDLLEALPVHLEADQLPRRALALLALECAAADEVAGLVEVDRPTEAHLVGRRFLGGDPGVIGGRVVHVEHEEAGLNARHVHGEDAAGRDAVIIAGRHERVPDRRARPRPSRSRSPGRPCSPYARW